MSKLQKYIIGIIAYLLFCLIVGFSAIGIYKMIYEKDIEEKYLETEHLRVVIIEWISDPIKVGRAIEKSNKRRDLGDPSWTEGLAQNNGKDCTIWAYEPSGTWERSYMVILGHEMMHCFRGGFHK